MTTKESSIVFKDYVVPCTLYLIIFSRLYLIVLSYFHLSLGAIITTTLLNAAGAWYCFYIKREKKNMKMLLLWTPIMIGDIIQIVVLRSMVSMALIVFMLIVNQHVKNSIHVVNLYTQPPSLVQTN